MKDKKIKKETMAKEKKVDYGDMSGSLPLFVTLTSENEDLLKIKLLKIPEADEEDKTEEAMKLLKDKGYKIVRE